MRAAERQSVRGQRERKEPLIWGKIQLRVPPLITQQTHLVGKLFVINAQLNSDMLAPKSPARYQIGPRSWPTLAKPSRVTLLRYIPFVNDTIYEICFIPLRPAERETLPFDYVGVSTLEPHTQIEKESVESICR